MPNTNKRMKIKDLQKIVNITLYFINKGKISARNFKKLKYLLYFACFDHYEKSHKKIVKLNFYRDKDDIIIKEK